jgi:hypothetical protein
MDSTHTSPWHPLSRAQGHGVGRGSRVGGYVAGVAAGLFLGFAIGAGSVGGASAVVPEGPFTSEAPQAVVPDPWCQFDIEPHRTVGIFGNDIQAFRVKLRERKGTSTIGVDVPNRKGRTWIGIQVPKGHAEDDVRTVSAKVAGHWHRCETA